MPLPTTAIINFSTVNDRIVQQAIRAVNRQIQEDFMPIWGQGRDLRLHASTVDPGSPDLDQAKVSADSALYLVTRATLPGALGYHDINTAEMPVGFVFTEPGDWTITLSHEALELILDPTVNIFVPGPHPEAPTDPDRWLWHSYEVCDAVERMSYEVDGVPVSDFLTPSYFRPGDAPGTRNDFLGVGVPSFGVMPDCHLGVMDPVTYDWNTIFGKAAARIPALAARARAFEHPKPPRPDDEELGKILRGVRDHVRSAARSHTHRPGTGLDVLHGITRTGRYQARATALKASKR